MATIATRKDITNATTRAGATSLALVAVGTAPAAAICLVKSLTFYRARTSRKKMCAVVYHGDFGVDERRASAVTTPFTTASGLVPSWFGGIAGV
jgi:hypothetical protein